LDKRKLSAIEAALIEFYRTLTESQKKEFAEILELITKYQK